MTKKSKSIYMADMPIRDAKTRRKVATLRRRTLDEMTRALDWAIDKDNAEDGTRIRLSSVAERSSFTGTASAAEYRDMLRDGWAAGVEGVEGLDGLTSDQSERLDFVRNVGGVFPVVPAAIAGEPNAMLDVRPMPADNVRAVTLVIDASFNSGVSSTVALNYARKVMQLVAWLQAERIDVSVYTTITVQMKSMRVIYLTQIRESGQILQPERIAVAVHPSWLRRAWFAMCERECHEFGLPGTEVCRGGYGQSRHASADELRQALPEAQSLIALPKVGDGDPEETVREALNIKIRREI